MWEQEEGLPESCLVGTCIGQLATKEAADLVCTAFKTRSPPQDLTPQAVLRKASSEWHLPIFLCQGDPILRKGSSYRGFVGVPIMEFSNLVAQVAFEAHPGLYP